MLSFMISVRQISNGKKQKTKNSSGYLQYGALLYVLSYIFYVEAGIVLNLILSKNELHVLIKLLL